MKAIKRDDRDDAAKAIGTQRNSQHSVEEFLRSFGGAQPRAVPAERSGQPAPGAPRRHSDASLKENTYP